MPTNKSAIHSPSGVCNENENPEEKLFQTTNKTLDHLKIKENMKSRDKIDRTLKLKYEIQMEPCNIILHFNK